MTRADRRQQSSDWISEQPSIGCIKKLLKRPHRPDVRTQPKFRRPLFPFRSIVSSTRLHRRSRIRILQFLKKQHPRIIRQIDTHSDTSFSRAQLQMDRCRVGAMDRPQQ